MVMSWQTGHIKCISSPGVANEEASSLARAILVNRLEIFNPELSCELELKNGELTMRRTRIQETTESLNSLRLGLLRSLYFTAL